MAPLLTDFAGVSIYPLGFARGGASEKYFIATAATGAASYGQSVAVLDKTTYWSILDQNNRLMYVPISSALAIGSAFYTSTTSYSYCQGNLKVDASGNVYLAPMEQGAGYSGVMKNNSSGTKQWAKRIYGYSGTGGGPMIDVDSSGNVYGVPWNDSSMSTNYAFGVAKWNSSGTIQWQNAYYVSGLNYGRGQDIKLTSNGSTVYIAGGFGSNGSPNCALVKLNSSGAVQWGKNAYTGYGIRIAVDSSDNVIAFCSGSWLGKYNSSGTLQWARNTGNMSVTMDVAVDPTGNVYALTTNGSNTLYLMKYNSSGTIQWQRSITRTGGALSLAQVSGSSRGMVATDTSVSFTATDNNQAVLFKLPVDGSLTGTHTIGSLAYVYASSSLSDTTGSDALGSVTVLAASNPFTENASSMTSTSISPTITTKAIP